MHGRYYLETLGCPKNEVDSDKLAGSMRAAGMVATDDPASADLVVVNTCAFIEDARRESIDTILALDELRATSSRLVVTGCLAERYGDELAAALPEADEVAGFSRAVAATQRGLRPRTPSPGGSLAVARPGGARGAATQRGLRPRTPSPGGSLAVARPGGARGAATTAARSAGDATQRPLIPVAAAALPEMDLLNLARPASTLPWAYVKIAEGCDRSCGFCAIPSFRGPQRSRDPEAICAEVDALGVHEVVLVAQDLASYGKDCPSELGRGAIVPLVQRVAARVERVRLLYLYPSDLDDALIDVICAGDVPYFDLSLQHVSKLLLRRMRRPGDRGRFLRTIDAIRSRRADAAFRSNFIVGYPGETEADHDELLDFVERAQLDWCGFFAYSPEEGTYAIGLDGVVPTALVRERLAELGELQDAITAHGRDELIGTRQRVLVDEPGAARSHREAPEIDGIVHVDRALAPGTFHDVDIVDALGTDLIAAGAELA